jgi:hypothetical protein
MNSTLSFEEEGAILFSSTILCIGSVVAFAFFLLQITNNKNNKTKLDCCFFTLLRLVWKKCCKCSSLNQELKKHLKEEGEEEEEETL